MELLVRSVTARNCLALLLLAAFLHLGHEHRGRALRAYREWRYPPIGTASLSGSAIIDEAQRREMARLEVRYRRVETLLARARRDGFKVGALEHKARAALALNTASHRRRAVQMLSEVEMAVPRKQRASFFADRASPASLDDIEPDVAPTKTRRRP